MKNKPIGFLRSRFIRNFSRTFISAGDLFLKFTPFVALHLKQSGLDKDYNITAREYVAVCLTTAALVGGSVALLATLGLSTGTREFMDYGWMIGAASGILYYIQLISYPKAIVNRRVKDLEKNLLFALRTILVQIRSGVPIFDSFVSIATGNYGQISSEFRLVIEKARSGQPVLDTLEDLAVRNPSMYFRRAIWQIVNAMKSGSDIGENLDAVIDALSKEQLIQIREYKSVLNPLAMMYMMIAVIIPSLSITLLIILSTMLGSSVLSEEKTFWLLLAGVIMIQFFFMNIIKSKRPNLIG